MAIQLQITDGTTTVDFVADSDYGLLGWPLKVASRRRSKLSERSPYNLVQESLSIFIAGSDAQDAQTNLLNLIKLLDQSQAFANNDTSKTAVRLVYQPNAISADSFEAVIMGNNNTPMVQLPRIYQTSAATATIDNISINFLREGLWVESTEETVSGWTALTPDTVTTVTFSAATDALSPIETSFRVDSGETHKGFYFMAEEASFVFSGDPPLSVTASTTDFQVVNSPVGSPPSVSPQQPMVAIVKLRNNSSIVSWEVAIAAESLNGPSTIVASIPAGSTDIQLVIFPPYISFGGIPLQKVIVKADQVDVSETIEVRELVVLVGDANIFYFDGENLYNVLSFTDYTLDPRILTAATPLVSGSGGLGISGGGATSFYSDKAAMDFGLIGISFGVSSYDWDLLTPTGDLIQTMKRFKGTLLPT